MRSAPEVVFSPPPFPRRGGRLPDSERDRVVSASARSRPGEYAVFASFDAHVGAENVRRRIHRGRGVWEGGRSAWSVAVRKAATDEWVVYVAYRDESMGVAP